MNKGQYGLGAVSESRSNANPPRENSKREKIDDLVTRQHHLGSNIEATVNTDSLADTEDTLQVELPAGGYEIELLEDPWFMELFDAALDETRVVDAALVSENTVNTVITDSVFSMPAKCCIETCETEDGCSGEFDFCELIDPPDLFGVRFG